MEKSIALDDAFKKALRGFRKTTGLTQLEFAERAGISHSYYADLESEHRKSNPTLETIAKISSVLGISIPDFFSALVWEQGSSPVPNPFWKQPAQYKKWTGRTEEDVEALLRNLSTLMQDSHFSEDEIEKTGIGFREIYRNAVIHGNGRSLQKKVHITVFLTHDEIRIAVRDEGKGFDPDRIQNARDRDRIIYLLDANGEEVLHGRGILLARMYMDNVRFSAPGNLVEITKFNARVAETESPMLRLQRMTITSWAQLVEYKDQFTGDHILRLPHVVERLSRSLDEDPAFRSYLTPGYIRDLKTASILHDIGKVGISDHILLKPDKLSAEEYEHVKSHVVIGGNFLDRISREWRTSFPDLNSYFDIAVNVAKYHHERWDGKGYFHGLEGEKIPLSARIVSVADVYDALTYHRPYRKGMSHEEACEFVTSQSGTMFDPRIVEGFKRVEGELKELLTV